MRAKEFAALVSLLEDPDEEVYNPIANKLVSEGVHLVPLLEKEWERTENRFLQSRIENILHQIQLEGSRISLQGWIDDGASNLLEGAIAIARFRFPDVDYKEIDSQISRLKQKVWLEFNENLTALEKVKVLNHNLFTVNKYQGNVDNFFDPYNHFINTFLETKKGGPVILGIFYSLVAQRLGMPVYGVSLPKNFLLAYEDRYSVKEDLDNRPSILFYINPFNKGVVLGRKEIEHFLAQNDIEPKEEYFYPCSNEKTIAQLVGGLMLSYQKVGNNQAVDDLKVLLRALTQGI